MIFELEGLSQLLGNLAPGIQTVTLLSQQANNQGTYLSYSITNVRRRLLTQEEKLEVGALLSERTLIWEFWTDYLTAAKAPLPKPSDRIQDSNGITYIVVQPVKAGYFSDLNDSPQLYSTLCQISVP